MATTKTRAVVGSPGDWTPIPVSAAAPRGIPPEILSTIEVDGLRHHRYRWHVAGGSDATGSTSPAAATSGEESASERIAPLSREILEDRWRGLIDRRDATKLQRQLDAVLRRLAEDLTRRDVYNESAVIDGQVVGLDMVMDIDGLEDIIRDWLLERAAGVAR